MERDYENRTEPDQPAASRRVHSKVSNGDGKVALTVPAPGLRSARGARAVAWLVLGVGTLVLAAVLPMYGLPALVGYLAAIIGVGLLVAASYEGMRAVLGKTRVEVSQDAVHIASSFPLVRARTLRRSEARGVFLGRARMLARGYSSPGWTHTGSEVVVLGDESEVHFGEGLDPSEKRWLRDLIAGTLAIDTALPAEVIEDAHGNVVQPPERFWMDATRYAVYCLLAGVCLLLLCVVLPLGAASIAAGVVIAVFSATGALVAYRNYRLERVASNWHRAVVKFLASRRGLNFSAVDSGEVASQLPEFAFFRGPRLFYNVAWSESDPHELLAFDFSCRTLRGVRDGVGYPTLPARTNRPWARYR